MSFCTLRGFYFCVSHSIVPHSIPSNYYFRLVKEEFTITHLHTRHFETDSTIILRHKEIFQYTFLRKISEYVYVYFGMLLWLRLCVDVLALGPPLPVERRFINITPYGTALSDEDSC